MPNPAGFASHAHHSQFLCLWMFVSLLIFHKWLSKSEFVTRRMKWKWTFNHRCRSTSWERERGKRSKEKKDMWIRVKRSWTTWARVKTGRAGRGGQRDEESEMGRLNEAEQHKRDHCIRRNKFPQPPFHCFPCLIRTHHLSPFAPNTTGSLLKLWGYSAHLDLCRGKVSTAAWIPINTLSLLLP